MSSDPRVGSSFLSLGPIRYKTSQSSDCEAFSLCYANGTLAKKNTTSADLFLFILSIISAVSIKNAPFIAKI